MKTISLTKGQEAIVDDDMFEFLNQWKWQAAEYGRKTKIFYAQSGFWDSSIKKNKIIPMHHFIIGKPLNGLVVDHVNGVGTDNRLENLHISTPRWNCSNNHLRRSGKTSSRFIGVHWYKGKWCAKIKINGYQKYLGRYFKEQQASDAYQKAVMALK